MLLPILGLDLVPGAEHLTKASFLDSGPMAGQCELMLTVYLTLGK